MGIALSSSPKKIVILQKHGYSSHMWIGENTFFVVFIFPVYRLRNKKEVIDRFIGSNSMEWIASLAQVKSLVAHVGWRH